MLELKCYYTSGDVWGEVNGTYMRFACEGDYEEYVEET